MLLTCHDLSYSIQTDFHKVRNIRKQNRNLEIILFYLWKFYTVSQIFWENYLSILDLSFVLSFIAFFLFSFQHIYIFLHVHTYTHTQTHTHTHTHIYIYIYMSVCVCVCDSFKRICKCTYAAKYHLKSAFIWVDFPQFKTRLLFR